MSSRVRSLGRRLRTPLVGLLCAAAAATSVESALSCGLGVVPPFSYLLAYSGMGVAVSIGLALLVALRGLGIELGFVLWVVAEGLLLSTPLVAAVTAAVAWALLRLRWGRDPTAVRRGLCMGAAVGVSLTLWPFVMGRLPEAIAHSEATGIVIQCAVFAAVSGLGFALSRLGDTHRALLGPAPALLFLLGLSAGPLLVVRLGTDSRPPSYGPSSRSTRPHVIVLVLDTVGWDHTSFGGYPRATTPRLRRFVAENEHARAYRYSFANGSWTLPSHASLLTGLLPSEHQVHMTTVWSMGRARRTELKAPRTLAEVYAETGYRTAAIVANGILFTVPGLQRGFDWWVRPRYFRPPGGVGEVLRAHLFPDAFAYARKPYPTARAINQHILQFFDACLPGPCFVLANYMEAHRPYVAQPQHFASFSHEQGSVGLDVSPSVKHSSRELEILKARYDEAIRSLDEAIGELLDQLGRRGLLGETWLVITSDHGESFGEHGVTEHGTSVYNEQTRIPLIVQPPIGVRLPPDDRSPRSLLDVCATLAFVASGRTLGTGRDLRATPSLEATAPIEFFGDPREFRGASKGPLALEQARAVVMGKTKLIRYRDRAELYDLEKDPHERNPIEPGEHARLSEIERHLPLLTDPADALGEIRSRVAPSLEAELRALGYVE